MSEPHFTLSAEDEADLALLADQPIDHTLLEIWWHLLGNIEKVSQDRISYNFANRVVDKWSRLSFADVPAYYAKYNEYLTLYRDALDEVIKKFPGSWHNTGTPGSEDSDAIANRAAYLELIYQWSAVTIQLEHTWDVTDPQAAIEVAAITDAATFVTGQQGLIQHLGLPQVNFDYDLATRDELAARLAEFQETL